MAVRRILAAALTAPLLTLAACGGGGSSVADPPISSAPSSSPTTEHRETPEHFIRRWFTVGTHMQNTGNTSEYLAMQSKCRGCRAVVVKVAAAYAAGGYYRTRGVRELTVRSSRQTTTGRVLDLRVDSYPTVFKTSAEAAIQRFHGGPATFQVNLVKSDATWRVTQFVQVAS
jgi:hypothetical protein